MPTPALTAAQNAARHVYDWTGVKLTEGENHIPGGIAPVYASLKYDLGTYIEPNVWMEHPMAS